MAWMSSDSELLTRWRSGDRAAGDALFVRHFDALYRFFVRKVEADAVEELIQRTLLACVEARDRFRGDSSFRTYLYGIARNQLLAYWRSRGPAGGVDLSTSSVQDLAPSPPSHLDARHEQRLLLAALRHIPLDLQIALELHYWEGMAGPELAEVLGVPEGTVRSRLRRAKELLTERLGELAESPALLESTLSDLDGWARSLEELFPRSG